MWVSVVVCQLCAARLPGAREISFQKFHSVVRFRGLYFIEVSWAPAEFRGL